jgi:hypothetical protein
MHTLTKEDRDHIVAELERKGVDRTTIDTLRKCMAWPGSPSQAYEIRVPADDTARQQQEAPPPGVFG